MAAEGHRRSGLYRNAVSLFGAIIAGGSILLILFALLLEISATKPSPYIGIFTFLIFPMFFAVGAVVFLYGMRRESLRRRRVGRDEALPYPRLDLNDPGQRKRFGYFATGGIFLAVLLAFTTYNAFLYSESVPFCGTLCHTVMKPEYTAYLASPHARVRCVDCHVGEGAQWFVKAKISGLRQVIAVTINSYPRPIPTPIMNLRPASETCEECHWPAKFFGTQLVQRPHFRYNEANTAEQISLGVRTGGGSPELGGAGIHWHMVMENRIAFAATDVKKQEIPLVEVRDSQGKLQAEFISTDYKGTAEQLSRLRRYPIDCIECHNRPTHIFTPPETAVDQAITSGFISPALPWVKKVAVEALTRDYPSRAEAHKGIAADIGGFYRREYPSILASWGADVDKAVATTIGIYDRSVFPEMKVNWRTYHSNISHRNWPGCFRCHDRKHVSKTGKVLGNGCTSCHTQPVRSPLMPLGTVTMESEEAWHPIPLEGKHATILCSRCHAAGYRPPTECSECHKFDKAAPMMGMACPDCHRKPGEAQPVTACKSCHTRLAGLHKGESHAEAACTDCHRPHSWTVAGRGICLKCHDDKKEHNAPEPCAGCHDFRTSGKKGK